MTLLKWYRVKSSWRWTSWTPRGGLYIYELVICSLQNVLWHARLHWPQVTLTLRPKNLVWYLDVAPQGQFRGQQAQAGKVKPCNLPCLIFFCVDKLFIASSCFLDGHSLGLGGMVWDYTFLRLDNIYFLYAKSNPFELLTGIARLVHVFDLNLMTQILIFPC